MDRESLNLCGELRVPGQISPLVWILAVIVKFLTSVDVAYVAPAFSLDGVVLESEGHHRRSVPVLGWTLQKRVEALAIQAVSLRQTAQIDQGRIEVDQADRAMAKLPIACTIRY